MPAGRFATLRSRLVASYFLVALLALLVAGISVTLLIWHYQQELVAARLADISIPLSLQIRQETNRGASSGAVFDLLNQTAAEAHIRILVVGANNRVFYDSRPDAPWVGTAIALPDPASQGSQNMVRGRYLAPDSVVYQYAAIRSLVRVNPASDRPAAPVLIVADRSPGLDDALAELIPRFGVATLAAFAASLLVGLTLAGSLYRPIKRLTDATDAVARGRTDERVPIEGPTEVAVLATRFNEMARQVESARQAMKDFVFDVSHEIKTPLTAINGFVEAMLDGTVSEPAAQRHALTIVRDQTRRLQRLVAELLDFARLESGQVEIQHVPVDLAEVLRHCAEVIELAAEDHRIRLETAIEPGTQVRGDEDRLEQVFMNLLDNAVQHTPEDGAVALRSRRNGESVVVQVSDTGPGIPREHLHHIFDRFYRGSRRAEGGTGLGLAIARQIVAEHNGAIGIASSKVAGTTFEVRLPLLHAG